MGASSEPGGAQRVGKRWAAGQGPRALGNWGLEGGRSQGLPQA